MAERIVVQLQHANSAVVLTTIKILLYLMNYVENRRLIEYLCKKMGPPLGEPSLTNPRDLDLKRVYVSGLAVLRPGGAIRCPAKYSFDHPTAACYPKKRCQILLLQVQRSNLRQTSEAGNHVPTCAS